MSHLSFPDMALLIICSNERRVLGETSTQLKGSTLRVKSTDKGHLLVYFLSMSLPGYVNHAGPPSILMILVIATMIVKVPIRQVSHIWSLTVFYLLTDSSKMAKGHHAWRGLGSGDGKAHRFCLECRRRAFANKRAALLAAFSRPLPSHSPRSFRPPLLHSY
jgi:hypothetical protein